MRRVERFRLQGHVYWIPPTAVNPKRQTEPLTDQGSTGDARYLQEGNPGPCIAGLGMLYEPGETRSRSLLEWMAYLFFMIKDKLDPKPDAGLNPNVSNWHTSPAGDGVVPDAANSVTSESKHSTMSTIVCAICCVASRRLGSWKWCLSISTSVAVALVVNSYAMRAQWPQLETRTFFWKARQQKTSHSTKDMGFVPSTFLSCLLTLI